MAAGKTKAVASDDWVDVPSQQETAGDWEDVPSKFAPSATDVAPSDPKPVIVPPGLQGPPDKPSSYMPSTSMWAEKLGAPSVRAGIRTIAQEPSLERKLHGVHQIGAGVAGLASPGLAPAMVANPILTLARLAQGVVGQQAVTGGLNALGVPQGYSEVAGDMTGLGMSGVDPKTVGEVGGSIPRVIRGAVAGGREGIKENPWVIPAATGAGEILGGHQGAAAGGAIGTGLVALPGAIRGGIEAYRNPLGPSSPFPTWRPNPNIANKTAFGGPGPSEAGNIPGRTIPRGSPPPLAEEAAQASVPFKPNPRIAAKTRFGGPGPSEAGNTPGTIIPRGSPPPIAEVAAPIEETVAPEPFKPGTQTKRNMPDYAGPSTKSQQSYRGGSRSGRNRSIEDMNTEIAKSKADALKAEASQTTEATPTPPVAKPSAGEAAQELKQSVTGKGGPGVETIKSTQPSASQIARANKLATGHNKYLSKFTGGKITAADVYDMKPAMADQLEAQIAAAKAGQLEGQALGGVTIPKYAKGGIVAPIPSRQSKPGRTSSRGIWYGPPGSRPSMSRHA